MKRPLSLSAALLCLAALACAIGDTGVPRSLPTALVPPTAAAPTAEQPTAIAPTVLPSPTVVPSPTVAPTSEPGLVSGQEKLWDIALDAENIYWTDCGSEPGARDGAVMKLARSGGEPVTLASGLACPTDIALDSGNVFWLAGSFESGYSLTQIGKDGGTPAVLAAGQDIRSLAADDSGVYWSDCQSATDACSLMRVSAGGGVPVQLASGLAYPDALVLDQSDLYWVNGGVTLMRIAKDAVDGQPQVIGSSQFYPQALAVDADHLYWIGLSYVMQVSKSDGSRVVLASDQTPADLTVDDAYVYWANYDGGVRRAPIGGGPVELIASDAPGGKNILVDDARVYWSNFDAGTLTAVDKAGGGPAPSQAASNVTVLAAAQEGLTGLVADASGVYWSFCGTEAADYQDGAVLGQLAGTDSPTVLASAQPCPLLFGSDADNLYWFGGRLFDDRPGEILRGSKAGGEPAVLYGGQSNVGGFALDGDRLVWSSCGSLEQNFSDAAILAAPLAGGDPVTLAHDCGLLATDASYVYWTNAAGLFRIPREGGDPQPIGPGAADLLTDGESLYYTAFESTSDSTFGSCADEHSTLTRLPTAGGDALALAALEGGSQALAGGPNDLYWATDCSEGIVAVPKAGGDPTVLAPVTGRVAAIAADGTAVYWLNSEYGTVNRLAR